MVGIILGWARSWRPSGSSTADAARTEVLGGDGGIKKMFIRELDAREMKQNAVEKKSKGLTYDDASPSRPRPRPSSSSSRPWSGPRS